MLGTLLVQILSFEASIDTSFWVGSTSSVSRVTLRDLGTRASILQSSNWDFSTEPMASVNTRKFNSCPNSHCLAEQGERAHAVKEFDQGEIEANEQALIVLASWLGRAPEHVSLLIPANKNWRVCPTFSHDSCLPM